MALNLAPLGAYARGSANVMWIIYVQMIYIKCKNGSKLVVFISPHLKHYIFCINLSDSLRLKGPESKLFP